MTRSQAKNQPAPVGVMVAEPEDNATTPGENEYDTDELAELPTDSEPEVNESDPGEENTPVEEQ